MQPDFNTPGFPFQNIYQQLAQAFLPANQQFTNGAQYGRWNGVNNNAFGLMPSAWPSLYGSATPPPMSFQPPYANNGTMGSNQGPGANPGMSQPPMPTGDNFGAIPKSAPAMPASQTAFNAVANAPGIQSTQGMTGANGAAFGFNIPQGYSTNGGLAQFSFSPTGDQTAVNRNVTLNGMTGGTGIEGGQYFAVGGPALDRWGRVDSSIPVLQPGANTAFLSGGIGPYGAGPANVDFGVSLPQHASAPQNPLIQARNDFLARHAAFNGALGNALLQRAPSQG